MKITKAEMLSCDAGWRPWLFIKITTDEGIVGYSECTDSHGSPRGMMGVIQDLEKHLIGKDPFAYEKIYWELFSATRQSSGGIIQKVIGGIENALSDIVGKSLGLPVYKLFGGPIREKIPVYWSHWGTTRVRAAAHAGVNPIRSLDDVAALVKETKERGFTTVKTNLAMFEPAPYVYMPGFGKSHGGPELEVSSELISQIVAYVGRIRETGGPDFKIIVDLNYNFRSQGYLQIAKALEPFKLAWLEMDCFDAKVLSRIRSSTTTPICSGENLYGLRQYKPFLDQYSMDICSIDIIWNGFAQSKKIADVAEIHEMSVSPHNYYSHLATFISAHFAAVTPNFKILEVDVDDVPWKDALTTAVPDIKDGVMHLTDKPGWGADIDEAILKAHPMK